MERKALFGRGSSLLISSPALVLFGAGVLLLSLIHISEPTRPY